MIYYTQEYHDERGATIIQNHVVDGSRPDELPEFIGVGAINIPTPMGLIEEKVLVKILAPTLKEAFAKFEETMAKDGPAEAKKVVEGIKQKIADMQRNQSRIVTANQMPPDPAAFQGFVKG